MALTFRSTRCRVPSTFRCTVDDDGADTTSEGYVDKWVTYGKVGGRQPYAAEELAVQPGVRVTNKDKEARGLITTQGHGRIGKLTPGSILLRLAEVDHGAGLVLECVWQDLTQFNPVPIGIFD